MARKSWTWDDDGFLRRHYGDQPCQWIARMLDRSLKSVYGRAEVLGLAKPQVAPHHEQQGDPSPEQIVNRSFGIRQERTQRSES